MTGMPSGNGDVGEVNDWNLGRTMGDPEGICVRKFMFPREFALTYVLHLLYMVSSAFFYL